MSKQEGMTGFGFFTETECGRALAKIAPEGCTRIIIDIPTTGDAIMKVYYQTVHARKILDLQWGEVIPKIRAINSDRIKNDHS